VVVGRRRRRLQRHSHPLAEHRRQRHLRGDRAPPGLDRAARPDGGTATVYLDGAAVATVKLSARADPRAVVWQKAWTTTGEHTIRIQMVSGRVDIDALARLS
jgi:hypothetical protein